MRKSMISTVALGGLASLVLLCAASPASAKAIEQCRNKYTSCIQHCAKAYDGPGDAATTAYTNCIRRTCDKQFDNCAASTGSGGNKVGTSADPVNPKGGPRGPLGGGVQNEPKSPPKTTGPRAPLGGGVAQSGASGSGAGGTILKSANGRR